MPCGGRSHCGWRCCSSSACSRDSDSTGSCSIASPPTALHGGAGRGLRGHGIRVVHRGADHPGRPARHDHGVLADAAASGREAARQQAPRDCLALPDPPVRGRNGRRRGARRPRGHAAPRRGPAGDDRRRPAAPDRLDGRRHAGPAPLRLRHGCRCRALRRGAADRADAVLLGGGTVVWPRRSCDSAAWSPLAPRLSAASSCSRTST